MSLFTKEIEQYDKKKCDLSAFCRSCQTFVGVINEKVKEISINFPPKRTYLVDLLVKDDQLKTIPQEQGIIKEQGPYQYSIYMPFSCAGCDNQLGIRILTSSGKIDHLLKKPLLDRDQVEFRQDHNKTDPSGSSSKPRFQLNTSHKPVFDKENSDLEEDEEEDDDSGILNKTITSGQISKSDIDSINGLEQLRAQQKTVLLSISSSLADFSMIVKDMEGRLGRLESDIRLINQAIQQLSLK